MEETITTYRMTRHEYIDANWRLTYAGIPHTSRIDAPGRVLYTAQLDGESVGLYQCHACNGIHARGTDVWLDWRYVCRECAEKAPACDICGKHHDERYLHAVDVNGATIIVCEDCLKRMSWTKCEDCGKWIPKPYAAETAYGYACAECFHDDYTLCDECGAYELTRELVYTNEGNEICRPCYESDWFTCEDCGDVCRIEEANETSMGDLVCDYCADHDYIRCDDCGRLVHRVDVYDHTMNNNIICDTCADNYNICEDCGSLVPYDDTIWVDGYPYCPDCAPLQAVHDYCYKPEPIFHGKGPLFFGIELETDNGDQESFTNDALEQLSDNENLFYFKTDSSLDDGSELVTHPLSFDNAISFDWEKLHSIAKRYGVESHNAGTCGLHIHVSRNGLGSNETERELTIAKLLNLFDRYYDDIVTFSRRDSYSLRWCSRNNASIDMRDDDESLIKKCRQEHAKHDRYLAINLQNKNTVEFRIFRGTLNPDTIRATITFVRECILWCRTTDNRSLTNPCKGLFEYLRFSSRVSDYAESRGLKVRR